MDDRDLVSVLGTSDCVWRRNAASPSAASSVANSSATVSRVEGDGVGELEERAALHEVLRGCVRQWWTGRDLAGQALGRCQRGRIAAELVDEPESVSLERVERGTGEQHLERDAAGEETGEPLGAACAGQQAELDLGHTESRAVGGDPEIARERELEPTAERGAVDGGDRRLRRVVRADRGRR